MNDCDICKESFDEQEIVIRESELPDGSKFLAFICKNCLNEKTSEN